MRMRQSAIAENPKSGMTLGELYEFCRQALSMDPDPGIEISALVSCRGRIREISTTRPVIR